MFFLVARATIRSAFFLIVLSVNIMCVCFAISKDKLSFLFHD